MGLVRDMGELVAPARSDGEIDDRVHARLVHVFSLTLTKLADGLIDPKLVLAWLLSATGAPGVVIGLLVPVREAGSLLPQMVLARTVAASRWRWPFWAAGSALQGVAAIAIAAAALLVGGATGGWLALGGLTVLALARAACSVSHKDALARTVAKARRGAVSGTAGSLGAALVLGFAALLSFGIVPLTASAISGAVAIAGVLWLVAGALFTTLPERPRPGSRPERTGLRMLGAFRASPAFRRFVLARAALVPTALAPPFVVMLSAGAGEQTLGVLGPLVIASSLAAILSATVWGRLSDRSSRRTMMAAGALAAAVYAAVATVGIATGGLGGALGAAIAIFVGQIAYEGARLGRKIHLTDMATDQTRAAWTAVSNTTIGAVLLAGGLFGLLADAAGPAWVLAVFAGISALAAWLASRLDEVQQR